MNTDLRFGVDILSSLPSSLSEKDFQYIGIIIDSNVKDLKEIRNLCEKLENQFKTKIFFSDLAEPDYHYLDEFRLKMSDFQYDCLLGIGGGSVMDLSKGLAVLLKNEGPAIDFKGFPSLENAPIPVVTVPTLAGTGSEIAFNAVFTDSDQKMRLGINTELNYPIMSFVDPSLSLSAPRNSVISGLMDCFCHTIEGYISDKASVFTKELSKSAFHLLYRSMCTLSEEFDDIDARGDLYLSSIYANMALNNVGSGLGGAFSYPLGALYGVPHGVGEGIFIPYLVKLYVNRGFLGYTELYDLLPISNRKLSELDKNKNFSNILFELFDKIQAPKNLNSFGITRDDISTLIEQIRGSFHEAPVEFTDKDAQKLFEEFIL